MMLQVMHGTVDFYNSKLGYGFITSDDGKNVIFLKNSFVDKRTKRARKGQRVLFSMLKGKNGKYHAKYIVRI